MNIVLVHGIFDNGAIFARLVRALEGEGHRCWAPSLTPSDARHGISDLAIKLNGYIEKNIDPDAPLVIVGFSMGCIIARYYMQVLGGCHRTKAFFAISGPHSGTLTAYLYFGQGAKDMRPRSILLRQLRGSEDRLKDIQVFAYWTSLDTTIVPASSGNWLLAHHSLNAKALLHRFMPGNRLVCSDIVRRLRDLDSKRAKPTNAGSPQAAPAAAPLATGLVR
jgi:triacylglycerol lipase